MLSYWNIQNSSRIVAYEKICLYHLVFFSLFGLKQHVGSLTQVSSCKGSQTPQSKILKNYMARSYNFFVQ